MNTPGLLRKAIANPRKVPRAFWERVGQDAALEAYRRAHRIDSQRTRIHEFISNDEFALIVLDACRYDVFKRLYSQFITGDLQRVWASGRWTAEYAARTWTEYYDLTYINSMPVNSDFYFELRGGSHRPSEHIETLVHVWEDGWDPERGTVPAETMTDTALGYASQMDDTRLVVHYAQPHAPYIGATEILPWSTDSVSDSDNEGGLRHLLTEDIARPNQRIYDRIQNGDLPVHELHQAYVDNLEYVLNQVVRLVQRLNCPVVITGDHGEHLGEDERFLHEEDSWLIRQVPWLVVSPSEVGRYEIEEEYHDRDAHLDGLDRSVDEIRDRLASLGYVD